MRIGMIAFPYIPLPPIKYGGTERVISELVKGLQELGHEVVLLAPGDSTIDCEIVPICERALGFGKDMAEQKVIRKEVKKINNRTNQLIKEILPRVDIIHSHGFDLLPFKNFPNVTTMHGALVFKVLDYYRRRKDLYMVSISKNQQGILPNLKYAGVAYNGLNPDDFPTVIQPDDYLCFLGRFDHEKSPHLAIQLAIKLNMKLKMAGKIDFQGKEYFEKEIRPFIDHPLIEYLGELDNKEKIELLSHAKCNLHPTNFREPFGLTVLEAAYCGTPTLAIKRGAMSELIEEGRTGMLVEDFEEGYLKIEECIAMDRAYIAQRSRMLFNYHTMAKQYEDAYQHVLMDFSTRQKRFSLRSPLKPLSDLFRDWFFRETVPDWW